MKLDGLTLVRKLKVGDIAVPVLILRRKHKTDPYKCWSRQRRRWAILQQGYQFG
jgi:hypothetical protein